MTTPDVRNVAESGCGACGHPWAQHTGICTSTGWTSWVAQPCACAAFPVGPWAWPADGHADCAGCGHPHSAHQDGQHCLVAAADEWDDCRCAGYQAQQADDAARDGVR